MPLSDVSTLRDAYKDSVRLLEATRLMQAVNGVDYGWAVMATPANLETLLAEGFVIEDDPTANDLLLAVRADSADIVADVIEVATSLLFGTSEQSSESTEQRPKDLRDALLRQPDSNVAVISVPGAYATLETHKALTAGLDVLLFSDNVSVTDEIALKQRAQQLGRLVMGPGAGTAMISGVGLGFANRVKAGPVGVVAAAGTGAQEVMSLLTRWGVGVSHVIGVGGRDLSEEVAGLMTQSAIETLEGDDATEAILLVSKPPSRSVAQKILGTKRSKPMIAALIGLTSTLDDVPEGTLVCNTLEAGAALAAKALGREVPDPVGDTANAVADVITALPQSRKRLVGLFSGGTLCYETMTIASEHIGSIYSNTPLDSALSLPAPEGEHVCLDLGEEEYTVGLPHPMIDPEARIGWMSEQIQDSSVAVVLIDVVLGDGSHENPASLLAPVARQIVESGAVVVAYLLGTELDPQGFQSQRDLLIEAGCIVPETAARAALAAAGIVNRDPALVYSEITG